jgi:hypothetical protein
VFYWVPSWRLQRAIAKRIGTHVMVGDTSGWQIGDRTIILEPFYTAPNTKTAVNIRTQHDDLD